MMELILVLQRFLCVGLRIGLEASTGLTVASSYVISAVVSCMYWWCPLLRDLSVSVGRVREFHDSCLGGVTRLSQESLASAMKVREQNAFCGMLCLGAFCSGSFCLGTFCFVMFCADAHCFRVVCSRPFCLGTFLLLRSLPGTFGPNVFCSGTFCFDTFCSRTLWPSLFFFRTRKPCHCFASFQ